jgi:Ca2+-binding EF-hand superfamily protein
MRKEALDRVELIFSLFDVDGNGYLEPSDFDAMTDRVVQAASGSTDAAKLALSKAFRRYWNTLATELDENHDGRISPDEFVACVLNPERFDSTIAEFADSLAALGDPDGDGLIDRPLFTDLMVGIGFAKPNIDALFNALAAPGSARITVPAWAAAIREYYHPELAGTAGDHLVPTA